MQDIPFRDRVFIEPLLTRQEFVERCEKYFVEGLEHYFVQVAADSVVGFIRLLKKSEWEALVWGKWLNTLMYACCVVAFDRIRLPALTFAVRDDNKRMIHLCQKFEFRRTGQEFITYRPSLFATIRTTNLTHFGLTAEEFQKRSEQMRKYSLLLNFSGL
jgi:hypothetical protein